MTFVRLIDLIPALQIAVAPVILISGVGLLLLSLTNRFGRAVDRARHLGRELQESPETDRRHVDDQVDNLYRRAQLIQTAIILAATSVLFAALLIVALFVEILMKWQSGVVVMGLFMLCLGSLVLSLVALILDIRLSLAALKIELGR